MESEVLDSHIGGTSALVVTPEVKAFLKETAKWAKFLAIVGFVMIGLFIVAAVFMSFFMGNMMASMPETSSFSRIGGGAVGLVYGLMGLIYLFPILYLYKFATKMKIALNTDDQEFLSESFKNLKSCYKFMGIFMAVIIGFYLIGIVMTIAFGGLMSVMG